jgi:hypothetical protein
MARFIVISFGMFVISLRSGWAQLPSFQDKRRDEAVQHVHQAFDQVIETQPFMETMPLAKFLGALERRLAPDKKLTLRIDKNAFGDNFVEVAATPIKFPPYPKRMHLWTVLKLAMAQIEGDLDYRIDRAGFVITTPERALYTAIYDIRDLLSKPESLALLPSPWNEFGQRVTRRSNEPVAAAALLMRAIVANVDLPGGHSAGFEQANIQVLNANRLAVRANAQKHAEIATLLAALRRLGDIRVAVQAHLYEVDNDFYTKLKNAKPVDWEEEERRIIEGKPATGESLFKLLEKQKMILAGDEIKVDDGLVANLLSRHHVVGLLPNPEQVVKREKERQAILEGVAFVAGMRVSPDRRCVRMQLTEKATEIRQVKKVKVVTDNEGGETAAEIPFLKETSHMQEFEIPDGGSKLTPVHYRPRSVQEKNRWWVLSITPRIIIEEEEQQVRIGMLMEVLPVVVADILKNPRLKTTREFYGSPGNKRFALVNSDAWTWPKELKFDTPEYQLTLAKREGQRLLGIRVDRFQEPVKDGAPATLTVTLVNVGGNSNGAVVGGCTLRYTARHTEKGWTPELSE